jgi:hypothetical protein
MNKTNIETTDSNWGILYRAGGLAALLLVAVVPAQIVIFSVAPPAETARGWFEVFQRNALLGLLSFEFLLVIQVIVAIPTVLALYVALRRANPSLMAIYLALSLVGTVAFIASRPGFEMLALSSQYAGAAADAERAIYLAAGEAVLTAFKGTAFQVSYVLGSIGGLILAGVMLQSTVFSKATAYVRMASSVLDFGIFIPVVGLYISIFSVLLMLAFNVMIALRLFRLAKDS